MDQKPKGTSSPSPNDTIKLELTGGEQVLDVESPDMLVPLSQNRGNSARIKEDDLSENEIEKVILPEQISQQAEPETAPQDTLIIEQEKGTKKRKLEETSIIESDKEEQLKRQKVEDSK